MAQPENKPYVRAKLNEDDLKALLRGQVVRPDHATGEVELILSDIGYDRILKVANEAAQEFYDKL